MINIRATIIAASVLISAIATASAPAAAASFDGGWNVRIASSRAACGNGTTVSIGISKGQVSSNSLVTASGRVADAGNINVSISAGMKHAIGVGRLAGTAGSGTWHGDLCSGTWTAQRM